MTQVQVVEQRANGVAIYKLKSDKLTLLVSNLGCHVLELQAPDRTGQCADVVLGFADVEDARMTAAIWVRLSAALPIALAAHRLY